MFFKKRKKAQPEEIADESLLLENENTSSDVESVNMEEMAQEVAENITVFEMSNKDDKEEKITSDCPTIRIPDLKELTDELVLAEAKELLSDAQNDNDNKLSDEMEVPAKVEDNVPAGPIEENAMEEFVEECPEEENSESSAMRELNASDKQENTIVDEEATENSDDTETVEDPEREVEEPPMDAATAARKKKAAKLLKKKKKSSFRRKQELKHRVSLLGNIVMWTVSICLFVFCLSNLYQQILNEDEAVGFFDVGNAVVVSESMVPVLEKNDFIVYKSTAIEQLRPEDIVVYKRPVADGHILIVHRLIAITDGYAITKGDNNSIQDEPFDADNIVGKVVLTVPQLGVAMESLASMSGIIAIIMLFCLLILSQIIYRKLAYNAWLKKLAQTKEERKAVQAFLDM